MQAKVTDLTQESLSLPLEDMTAIMQTQVAVTVLTHLVFILQAYITGLPQEVLATPLGQMLAPMLSPLEQQLGNIHQQPAGESGAASQNAQGSTITSAAQTTQGITSSGAASSGAARPSAVQVWLRCSYCIPRASCMCVAHSANIHQQPAGRTNAAAQNARGATISSAASQNDQGTSSAAQVC